MAVSRINEAGLNVNQYGNRNIFQNGACLISQRGTSFATANGMTLDRWKVTKSGTVVNVVTQESDGPTGFSKSLKVSPSTADSSLAASDYSLIIINIEGQDLQQLAYGTSGAKDLTMSFYAKSNVTGNITVTNEVNQGPPFQSRYFTISTADTWTRHTLTWTGNPDTAIDNDNTTGIEFQMFLAAGSNFNSGTYNENWQTTGADRVRSDNINLSSSTSNYFQITGLQIEVGDTATAFEHRSYGDELARCQRYCLVLDPQAAFAQYGFVGWCESNTSVKTMRTFPVTMRSAPSFSRSGSFSYDGATSNPTFSSQVGVSTSVDSCRLEDTVSNGNTGQGVILINQSDATAKITFDAEL